MASLASVRVLHSGRADILSSAGFYGKVSRRDAETRRERRGAVRSPEAAVEGRRDLGGQGDEGARAVAEEPLELDLLQQPDEHAAGEGDVDVGAHRAVGGAGGEEL